MDFGLVQNSMLFGMLAFAIPFIIHLMFRQKPREVSIGSVRFLQEIMEKHRNRRRVMRWFLMALRMAGIALLALLFARPFFTAKSDNGDGQKFVGILIDGSASMQLRSEGTRLIDSAIEQAKTVLRSSDANTRFEVAFFDHQVSPVSSLRDGERDRNAANAGNLLSQLAAPESSYSATDYAAAFRWAHDVCTNSKAASKELHVFTDLQQSGLAWSEVEPMPDDVLVKVHDLGRDLPNNVAITAATPQKLIVRPGESTTVAVSVFNAGPFTLDETPVVLNIKNGNRTIHERQNVKLEQGSIETVNFDLPELEEGIWQGEVGVELLDDLQFDNQRKLALMSAPQYRVLVRDGDPNGEADFLSETYYIQSAMRLAPAGASYVHSPYVPKVIERGDSLANGEIVLMANVKEVRESEAARLREFVEQGGGLLVFAGELLNGSGYGPLAAAGLVPGEIVSARESFDLPWRVGEWDENHSMFSMFNDTQNGDLRKLAFRGVTEFNPHETANVVARFVDGKPFVVEQSVGDQGGGVVWVMTACDGQWSNWAQTELFVPIVHQLLGHLTGLNDGGPVREQLIDTSEEDGIHAPAIVRSTRQSPGVYVEKKSWRVVNVSPRESETDRCSVGDFVDRFALNVGDKEVPQKVSRAGAFGSPLDLRQNEIWHWILFALVIVVVAEFFVGNRTVA